MKKKLALGCLIVAIAVLVIGGGAAYFYVIRPLTNTARAAMELPKLAELDQRVSNKRPFSPPESGELQPSDVQRFLQVTSTVLDGLEGKAGQLEEKYRALEDQRNPGPRQVLDAYADIIRLVVEAKELQVSALNSAGFSLAEYSWVKASVFQAAGQPYSQVDITALSEGEVEEEAAAQPEAAPAVNVELVSPHVQQVEEYMPLAVFGL